MDMFEKKRKYVAERRKEQLKRIKKQKIIENIIFTVVVMGVIVLFSLALYFSTMNAIKKCEAAGHEITFCKSGLD